MLCTIHYFEIMHWQEWLYDKINAIMYFPTFNCLFYIWVSNNVIVTRTCSSVLLLLNLYCTTFGHWEVLLGLLPLIFVCSYQFRSSRCKWTRWVADGLIVNSTKVFFFYSKPFSRYLYAAFRWIYSFTSQQAIHAFYVISDAFMHWHLKLFKLFET